MFYEVSKNFPCPKCGNNHWCSFDKEQNIICCRRNTGSGIYRLDTTGTEYWLHFLHPSTTYTRNATKPLNPVVATTQLSASQLNEAYSCLLSNLDLGQFHKENLLKRGLTDSQISTNQYKSYSLLRRRQLALKLQHLFGEHICKDIPGMYKDSRGVFVIGGCPGLLIPVRDPSARIVALKIRCYSSTSSRYSYLSSKSHGGKSPGHPLHFPLAFDFNSKLIRITEGELKADIATVLSGTPTISIPGILSWRMAIPVLKSLKPETVRLAFDMDFKTNPDVARALIAAFDEIKSLGFNTEVETWI